MPRTVTVGLDGSRESLAAAHWAAREADLRRLPLKLVNVWEPVPLGQAPFMGKETQRHWSERVPRDAADQLSRTHPDLEIVMEQRTGHPGEVLPLAAAEADLLVLGSRGLSGFGGFLVGSVGQAVVARAELPVVLVRGPETDGGEPPQDLDGARYRPVVLGLDANAPDDKLIEFAVDEALRRNTTLHAIHAWNLPPYYSYGLPSSVSPGAELGDSEAAALTQTLLPWRQKYPAVNVVEESVHGRAVNCLVDAAHEASLLVVGRRIRRSSLGVRIGSVTHAVLHHSTAPVAVIPHS
ncbi:universal stress protein [Streptomyces brevispora]|uniref:Nucleotide-binding universal stress UspA family protein n=1 Tax=Streptomyces brevispora TaxID=887462 RepID=A0A561UR11_9ACTN|nr:universal stress protein [Streptomyces brevispora]TWG01808.1 nucleotide-binding universal stress UspA family protein [Streptomyces brevispora]WSC16984.1 universal stress protein [Streptomyces brevispora]